MHDSTSCLFEMSNIIVILLMGYSSPVAEEHANHSMGSTCVVTMSV